MPTGSIRVTEPKTKPLMSYLPQRLVKTMLGLLVVTWCAPATGQSVPITVGSIRTNQAPLTGAADFGPPPRPNARTAKPHVGPPSPIARTPNADWGPPPPIARTAKADWGPRTQTIVRTADADFGPPPPIARTAKAEFGPPPFPGQPKTFELVQPTASSSDFAAPPMTNTRSAAEIPSFSLELSPPTNSSVPNVVQGPTQDEEVLLPPLDTAVDPSRDSAPTYVSQAQTDTDPIDVDAAHPLSRIPRPSPNIDTLGWWQTYVSKPMRQKSQPLPVTLEQIIAAAIQNSAQIRVFSDAPLIRDTEVIESAAEFDWSGFVDTMWYDTDVPVGSTLTTGGPPRYQDHRWEQNMGARRKTTRGGQFEIAQRYGHENSNSIFFVPNNQGTTRLTASYTQPLLRGGGKIYNTSLIVLAQINASIAQDEFANQLQGQLLDVTRAYWSLYRDRGALLQQQRLYKRGELILSYLEHRQEIDALANQIVRARAAVSSRKADLYRAAADVKNSEARVRALVNAPYLGTVGQFELLPQDSPSTDEFPVEMATSMTLAIKHRPEVHQALKQIRASSVRMNMAKNEVLPLLDMVLESYLSGLNGNSNVGRSLREQFSDGAPSYSAGFQMELPLRNRAARSRLQRRTIESRQLQNNFEATVSALGLEVETSVREVQTTYRETLAKYESMKASENEVDYITKRWKHLTGGDRSASLILEDLLAAQERLQHEEFEFLNAQVTYNLAITSLKRVTGTLLQLEQVTVDRVQDVDGNPQLLLDKATYDGVPLGGVDVLPPDAVPPASRLDSPLP